jgi:hypothetical protein
MCIDLVEGELFSVLIFDDFANEVANNKLLWCSTLDEMYIVFVLCNDGLFVIGA